MPYRCRLPYIATPQDFQTLMCGEVSGTRDVISPVGSLFVTSVIIEGLAEDLAARIQKDFTNCGGNSKFLAGKARGEDLEIILSGTIQQLEHLSEVSSCATDERGKVYQNLRKVLDRLKDPCIPPIVYDGKQLDFSKKTYIMGILNVTPDSFYDGGRYLTPKRAVDRALQMEEEGADILDVGGESTRPGSDPVPARVQAERILPVIEGIRKESKMWISVDTYRSEVARAAIAAGADMINDISGARFDSEMAPLAARTGVPIILMHIRGTPKDMQVSPTYGSLISDLLEYFEDRIQKVEEIGVAREKILLDPGIGFGKTVKHNLSILKHLTELKVLGRPVLVGTSRKSFIGSILNDRDPEKRLWGSLATAAIACWNGAHIVRVHDVMEAKDALVMAEAIRNAERMP